MRLRTKGWELQESDGQHMVWYSDAPYYSAPVALLRARRHNLARGHRLRVINVTTGRVLYERVGGRDGVYSVAVVNPSLSRALRDSWDDPILMSQEFVDR